MLSHVKKLIVKSLGVLLFMCLLQGCKSQDSCFILEPCITREVPLSLEEVEQLEYPLYLPSSQTLQLLDLEETPIISQRTYDELCQYIHMEFSPSDSSRGGILIRISNGCDSKYITPSMYLDGLFLSWAENQTAYLLEQDDIRSLIFKEQNEGIRYFVFSEKSLSETMKFLESMELVSTD